MTTAAHRPATLDDVARAAGVSRATASRVIAGTGFASPAARELVTAAADRSATSRTRWPGRWSAAAASGSSSRSRAPRRRCWTTRTSTASSARPRRVCAPARHRGVAAWLPLATPAACDQLAEDRSVRGVLLVNTTEQVLAAVPAVAARPGGLDRHRLARPCRRSTSTTPPARDRDAAPPVRLGSPPDRDGVRPAGGCPAPGGRSTRTADSCARPGCRPASSRATSPPPAAGRRPWRGAAPLAGHRRGARDQRRHGARRDRRPARTPGRCPATSRSPASTTSRSPALSAPALTTASHPVDRIAAAAATALLDGRPAGR